MKETVFVTERPSSLYVVVTPNDYQRPGIVRQKPKSIQFNSEFDRWFVKMVMGELKVQRSKVGTFRPKTDEEAKFLREKSAYRTGGLRSLGKEIIVEVTEKELEAFKKAVSKEALARFSDMPAPEESSVVARAVKVPAK